MKSNFLAGFIATIIAIVVVVSLAVFLTLVIEVEPTKNWFTITAAFLTISTWLGVYKWLKPKDNQEVDNDEVEKVIDDTVFKDAYLRTSRTGFRAGVFFMLLGIPAALCVLLIAKDPLAGDALKGLIALTIIGSIGILVMVVSGKKKKRILNGTDPLIHAIDHNISDHVVWFYGVVTSQKGMAIKELNNYTIMIYAKDFKKTTTLGAKNEKNYQEIMAFLEMKFPDAQIGTSPEIKKAMKTKYGYRRLM